MARTSRTRSPRTPRRQSDTLTGFDSFFVTPHRHWFFRYLGYLVRARAELFLILVVWIAYVGLQALATTWGHLGPIDPVTGHPGDIVAAWDSDTTTIVMVLASGVIVIVPVSRRFVMRRFWCVISRHRIRTCFARSRRLLMTRNGRMPFLLWSRPSPIGERVRVWLPAGLAVKDLESLVPELAAACWARDARVTQARSQAAMAVIDIVRRDPLAASRPITPVLINDLTGTTGDEDDYAHYRRITRPLPDRRTLIVPTVAPTTGSATGTDGAPPRQRRTSTNGTNGTSDTSSTGKTDPPVVSGLGGVDVSDYI